ncbi:MAG TPA: DNA cytosine methyltransferase [Chloroflexia bacterium]|nr:DNA cytosine methyltransferase [Chloroflexia bacterium]
MSQLISLFCGPGGFDEGFRNAGFTTRLAYDNDIASIITHQYNHPEANAVQADLSLIGAREIIDEWNRRTPEAPIGVIGGPPCQSFSVSNVHQTDNDPRHRLPEHYARILRGLNEEFELDFFVFENVPGLVTIKHIEKFANFKNLFEEAGFNIFEGSLDSQHFGVPQMRRRVFVVGLNRNKYPQVQFKFPAGNIGILTTVRNAIGTLPEPIYFSKNLTRNQIPFHPNHWCMRPLSHKFSNGTLIPGEVWGRSFRVLEWDRPSYTVAYGHREVHVHPSGNRRLSVLEAMLLQGFTTGYELLGSLSQQIRLVSEAVSPPVAQALAREIAEQLNINLNQHILNRAVV